MTSSHSCSLISHKYFVTVMPAAAGATASSRPTVDRGLHRDTPTVHRRDVDCGRYRLAAGRDNLGHDCVAASDDRQAIAVDRAAVVGNHSPPASPAAIAIARPMPRPPPVTTTACPRGVWSPK